MAKQVLKWVMSLKVGDPVFVTNNNGTMLKRVEEISPTGLPRVMGSLFDTEGNIRKKVDWDNTHIEEATPDRLANWNRKVAVKRVQRIMRDRWETMTYAQATQILRIFDENIN